RLYMARLLASTGQPDDTLEAERLGSQCLDTQALHYSGMFRGVLAQTALRRGDFQTAESQGRTACQILSHFPAYKPDIVALLSRILAAQGKHAESLEVCEEALREQDKLGIEPYGLLELYVALAEARERAGLSDAARQAINRARPVLQRRILDIPDEA